MKLTFIIEFYGTFLNNRVSGVGVEDCIFLKTRIYITLQTYIHRRSL